MCTAGVPTDTPTPDPRPAAPLAASLVQALLRAAGFTVLGTETVTHTGTLQEKRAWLTVGEPGCRVPAAGS